MSRGLAGALLHVLLLGALLAPLVTTRDASTALHVYLAATLVWWSLEPRE